MMRRGKKKKEIKKDKKKKKESGSVIGEKLLNCKPIKNWVKKQRTTDEYVRMMEPRARPEEGVKKVWSKRLGIVFVLIVAAGFLAVICITEKPEEGFIRDGHYLIREDDGELVSLQVSGESTDGSWQKQFLFDIDDREFDGDEIAVINEHTKSYIDDVITGENEGLDHIQKKLVLSSSVPGTGVGLKWTVDERYLDENGSIVKVHIPSDGIDTELMVEATWKNYDEVFHYDIHIDPPEYTAIQLAQSAAKKDINKSIKKQNTEKLIELPEKYGYTEEDQKKNYMPVLLVIGVICLLPVMWREKMKKDIKNREEQLLMDHPAFINKVMLLLGAGLSLRYAIERIATEYERELKEGGEKHYVYEELCVTMQEIHDGVTETQAVESFGRRLKCMPYMRFSSLITQNLRKGAEGILVILEKEAYESMTERKQAALRAGEKAGTKLLFPMILMLGLVMAIIMVPAFMSF